MKEIHDAIITMAEELEEARINDALKRLNVRFCDRCEWALKLVYVDEVARHCCTNGHCSRFWVSQ